MGWNSQEHWKENFERDTNNLTSYDDWDVWNSDFLYYPAIVRNDRCRLALGSASSPEGFTGAVTADPHTPRSHFNEGTNRRNKWRATMDFDPKLRYDPIYGHAAVFLRVHNNRRYRNPDTGKSSNDTTRFGCFIRGEATGSTPQGALQLDGDKRNTNPLEKCRVIERFSLDEDPFDNTTGAIYRVEIIEEELYLPPLQQWIAQWQAKVYNGSGQKIGESTTRTARYLEQQGMVIPSLDHSRIAIGSGPARQGRVDATEVATNYWIY